MYVDFRSAAMLISILMYINNFTFCHTIFLNIFSFHSCQFCVGLQSINLGNTIFFIGIDMLWLFWHHAPFMIDNPTHTMWNIHRETFGIDWISHKRIKTWTMPFQAIKYANITKITFHHWWCVNVQRVCFFTDEFKINLESMPSFDKDTCNWMSWYIAMYSESKAELRKVYMCVCIIPFVPNDGNNSLCQRYLQSLIFLTIYVRVLCNPIPNHACSERESLSLTHMYNQIEMKKGKYLAY